MEFGKRHDTTETTDFCPCQLAMDLLLRSYGETGVMDFGLIRGLYKLVESYFTSVLNDNTKRC